MEYRAEIIISQVRKINFSGNVIPHSWYPAIKFENGKTDLISIAILAEIIYWYRPTEIKCERTGRLLGYKKKFHADMLQRSNASFADQFGLSKRQVADSLKRLEKLGLIVRELRTIDTEQGKLGNVQYLAPIISAVSKLDNDTEKNNLLNDEDDYTPDADSVDSTPITFKRDRGHSEVVEGALSNAIGIPFERDTYTETTTQITTKNTTTDNIAEKKLHAVVFSKNNKMPNVDALIDDALTESQKNLIQKTSIELSNHVNCSSRHLGKEIEAAILSKTAFTNANRDFFKKLNTIKKMINSGRWQIPAEILEREYADYKSKINPIQKELNDAKLDQKHWEKMTKMSIEKGNTKQADDFKKLLLEAKKQIELIKSKYQIIHNSLGEEA